MLDRHDRERPLVDEHDADEQKQPIPPPQPEPDETSEPASPRDYQEGFWG